MTCSNCGATIQAGEACSLCGGSPRDGVADEIPSHGIGPLLAAANLHRMRGEWSDAEARCVDVLRADPNNVHAHSLLGDILRDQGHYEDAAQWYKLALDLCPTSAGDRAKLASVEAERTRHEAAEAPPIVATGRTQPLFGLPPTVLFQGLWVLVAVFVVGVAAILVSRQRAGKPATFVPAGTVRVSPAPAAAGPTGSTASSAPPGPRETSSPPAVAAPAQPPGSLGGSQSSAANAEETQLRDAIARQAAGFSGSSVGPVVLDPRDGHVTAAIGIVGPTQGTVQDAALAAAYGTAAAIFGAAPGVQRATISVRMSGAAAAETVFVGDADRAAIQALGPQPTTQQMAQAFRAVWLRGPAGSGTGPAGPAAAP